MNEREGGIIMQDEGMQTAERNKRKRMKRVENTRGEDEIENTRKEDEIDQEDEIENTS